MSTNKNRWCGERSLGDQLMIENRPTSLAHTFKLKTRMRVETASWLKNLIITDESCCHQPAPAPVPAPKLVSRTKNLIL